MTDTTAEPMPDTCPVTSTYPFRRERMFELPWELAWLRCNAPVSRIRLANGGTGWLVTRMDDVRALLRDERFSRRPVRETAVRNGAAGSSFDFGLSIADPADHARWRSVVNTVFTSRQAESMRPRIGELVDELLDELAAAGPPADLMAGLALRLPLRVLCELFAVPADLRPGWHEWADGVRGAGSVAVIGESMRVLHDSATALVVREREAARGGCLTALTMAGDGAGRGLSDRELVSTVLMLTIAGFESVAAQFGNGFLALFQHPAELDALRADRSLVGAAVEEMLRYAQASTGFAGTTYTTCDVELGGVTIPAGSAVFISLDSAGRDEAQVADPDRFDLARGSVRGHLSFGSGPHFCLGAPLARVELQEATGRVLRRFPGLRLCTGAAEVPIASNLLNSYPAELRVTW